MYTGLLSVECSLLQNPEHFSALIQLTRYVLLKENYLPHMINNEEINSM